jgi:hypothetical protein
MTGPSWHETRRTGLVFSPGGHWAELQRALVGITFDDVFHVTFADGRPPSDTVRRYHLCHPRRSVWRALRNAWQSLGVLRRERPAVLISTGADVAVPILYFGKLAGVRIVFIETAGSATPTLAGRLVYPIADLFIVQWADRLEHFPKAVLAEGLLL